MFERLRRAFDKPEQLEPLSLMEQQLIRNERYRHRIRTRTTPRMERNSAILSRRVEVEERKRRRRLGLE